MLASFFDRLLIDFLSNFDRCVDRFFDRLGVDFSWVFGRFGVDLWLKLCLHRLLIDLNIIFDRF